jgi:hypothetical protein
VRDEHRRRTVRYPRRLERFVARGARPRLEISSRFNMHASRVERRAEARRRAGDDIRFTLAAGTEPVVDVDGDRRQRGVHREGEQRERVGAPGACDDDRRGDVGRHLHRNRHRHGRASE